MGVIAFLCGKMPILNNFLSFFFFFLKLRLSGDEKVEDKKYNLLNKSSYCHVENELIFVFFNPILHLIKGNVRR